LKGGGHEHHEGRIAHDRMMAEHHEWMARREAAVSPVRKSDGDGLVYRTNANGAQAHAPAQDGAPSDTQPAPAAAPETDWSGWEAWMRGHLDKERLAIFKTIAEEIFPEVAWRDNVVEGFRKRDERIARLEGQVEMLIALLGKSDTVSNFKSNTVLDSDSKAADVVELPRFIRKVHNG